MSSAATFPRQVGRYELLDKIGTGGMAEVFRARRLGSADTREYAVKQLTDALSRDPLLVSMFVDEARIASQLAHENVVEVVEFGVEDSGRVYMVLEYIDGHDLRWVLATSARAQYWVPVEFSLTVARDLCRALGHAHEAAGTDGQPLQIVHRDVSHSNVFLSRRGEVKLADFGIARARGRQSQTRTGLVKGKLGYLSPEQVRAEPLDGRSDLFAATVVLWELLTQRRMFVGETDFKTMLAVCSEARTPPSAFRPGLPASIDELVLKGLQVKRDNRFASAKDMELAIERVAREHGLPLGPSIVVQVIEYLDQFSKNSPARVDPKSSDATPVVSLHPSPLAKEKEDTTKPRVFGGRATTEIPALGSLPPSDIFAKPWTEDEPTEATPGEALGESDPQLVEFVAGREPSYPRRSPGMPLNLTERKDRVRAAQASFQNLPIYLRSSGEIRPLVAFDSVLFAIDPRIRKGDDALSADRSRWMLADDFARLADLELASELRDPVKPVQKGSIHGARILGVIGDLTLNGFTGRLVIDREEDRQVCLLQTGAPVALLSSQPEHQLLSALLAGRALGDARSVARVLHQVLAGSFLDQVLERDLRLAPDLIADYRLALAKEIFADLIRPGEALCSYEKSNGWPSRAFLASAGLELVLPALNQWSDAQVEEALDLYRDHPILVMPGFPLVARQLRLKQEVAPILRRLQPGRTVVELLNGLKERPDQLRLAKRLVLIFIETGAIGFG